MSLFQTWLEPVTTRGRPSKLTQKLIDDARELAEAGLPLSKIAISLGIDETTVYAWLREGKSCPDTDLKALFSQVIHEGWINTGKNHLINLAGQSAAGNTTAATWFLTHHPFFRDDFSDAAADRRTERKTIATVVDAIAAAGLAPDDERRVLLQIQARGLGTPADEPAVEGEP